MEMINCKPRFAQKWESIIRIIEKDVDGYEVVLHTGYTVGGAHCFFADTIAQAREILNNELEECDCDYCHEELHPQPAVDGEGKAYDTLHLPDIHTEDVYHAEIPDTEPDLRIIQPEMLEAGDVVHIETEKGNTYTGTVKASVPGHVELDTAVVPTYWIKTVHVERYREPSAYDACAHYADFPGVELVHLPSVGVYRVEQNGTRGYLYPSRWHTLTRIAVWPDICGVHVATRDPFGAIYRLFGDLPPYRTDGDNEERFSLNDAIACAYDRERHVLTIAGPRAMLKGGA